jgi:hypothetical protein
MSSIFEATADFFASIKSVDVLIKFAEKESELNHDENRSLFLKLAIVSSVTKLQVYIEKVLDEFLYKLKLVKKKNKDIPLHSRLVSLKLFSAQYSLLNKLENPTTYSEQKLTEIRHHILALNDFCDDKKDIGPTFLLKTKFPLGKNGLNELKELFRQIEGEDDIFATAPFDIEELNALLNIRHNIVHQDQNPQLTELKVNEYKEFVQKIAVFVDAYLAQFLLGSEQVNV